MQHESYSKFILLSEKSEENIEKLSEAQLNSICSLLHNNIVEAQYKIMEETSGQKQR